MSSWYEAWCEYDSVWSVENSSDSWCAVAFVYAAGSYASAGAVEACSGIVVSVCVCDVVSGADDDEVSCLVGMDGGCGGKRGGCGTVVGIGDECGSVDSA